MKKYNFFILVFLFAFNPYLLKADYGSGDLNISGNSLDWFVAYIQKPGGNRNPNASPMKFSITSDGYTGAWYYSCLAATATQCQSLSDKILNKECARKMKVSSCQVLAVGRVIKWRNGIAENRKDIKFRSSDSREQIISKLTELGLIKDESIKNNNSLKKPKERDIADQLKDLSELYKSGSITKKEFEDAKKELFKK